MNTGQLQPIAIPATTPWRYISFNHALNLRAPGELTGDWHFKVMFFCAKGEPQKFATVAGRGTSVDTSRTLGSHGVRDMADELARKKVRPNTDPVFVANHYRAIADIAIAEVQAKHYPRSVTVRCVNQWLDTPEQIDTLIDEYLRHLPKQLDGAELTLYDEWLSTIRYEE